MLVGSSVGVSRTLVHAPLFAAQGARYAIALPILIVAARSAGARVVRPRGREWLWLAGIAVTGLVLFNLAIVRGVAHAQPAAIAVAVAFVPVLLGVLGPLLQGQTPSRRILAAAAVVTVGSVLVEGAVPVLPRHGAWGVSVHSVWLGAIMFFGLGLVTEGPAAAARLTGPDWAAVGYLALMVTAVAFILWYSSVAALGPGLAGLLAGIAPIAAALTGMLTGAAAPGPLVWLGILVVLAGLATGLRAAPSRPATAPPSLPSPSAAPAPPARREGELLSCSATTTPSPGGSRPSGPA